MIKTNQNMISEEQVANYLRQHPEFFAQQSKLLEDINIPHASGAAVSLVAKQLEVFRQKHQNLENQLKSLIKIARENDTSFNRLHKLTLALLEANTFEQAVGQLEIALSEFFSTEHIAIRLVREPLPDVIRTDIFIVPDDYQLQLFNQAFTNLKPYCGHADDQQMQFLFNEQAGLIQSCALIPIMFPRIKALLAIGSHDPKGFHPEMGKIFLTQISEIVASRLISLLPETAPEAKELPLSTSS